VEKFALITTLQDRPGGYVWCNSFTDPVYLARPIITFWYDVALWNAAKEGHTAIVQRALDNGADPRVIHSSLFGSVFDVAAKNGYARIVSLLLLIGVQAVSKDMTYEKTAMIRAAREGRVDVVRILLDKGFTL
jgi:ankyrin repeat protein